MKLHPDLLALLPPQSVGYNKAGNVEIVFTFDQITAFAVGVAKLCAARCREAATDRGGSFMAGHVDNLASTWQDGAA